MAVQASCATAEPAAGCSNKRPPALFWNGLLLSLAWQASSQSLWRPAQAAAAAAHQLVATLPGALPGTSFNAMHTAAVSPVLAPAVAAAMTVIVMGLQLATAAAAVRAAWAWLIWS